MRAPELTDHKRLDEVVVCTRVEAGQLAALGRLVPIRSTQVAVRSAVVESHRAEEVRAGTR